ncbi:MAG: flagellar export protein FliJ [Desulfovibrio sp.]|jgi:flagellar FliJ protein
MASPFHFPLQKVLEFREQLEDRARLALAKAQTVHDEHKRLVDDMQDRLDRHVHQGLAPDADANEMWLWRQYKQALEQDLAAARQRLAKLALNLQKCRREALKASKDRKLLDKLKQQQAARHRHEEHRKEEKENDEMAALRFRREDF